MEVKNLKTMHCAKPISVDSRPYFSWEIQSREQAVIQEAYRIIVREEEGCAVWDSGRVESKQSIYIHYEGENLKSRTGYTWTVTVWDNHGNAADAASRFETAFLTGKEWRALWAESCLPVQKRKPGFGHQSPATMFRKAFQVPREVKKARLYATCHGVYRLTVNGMRPDGRELAPEFTTYEKYLCYQVYDVTALLQRGENVIGFYVGDGWYCGPKTQPYKIKRNTRHAVLFQMEIEYKNGECMTVISDRNVKTAYGAVCFSDLFAGEKYKYF